MKAPTIHWGRLIFCKLIATNPNPRDSERRARQLKWRSSAGGRSLFTVVSLSNRHIEKKQRISSKNKRTNGLLFKKYYKSSLQAVKVKLQSGCYVQRRKKKTKNKNQPSVQHRELESTEEPEVLMRRTRASTETARGKKKKKEKNWLTLDHVSSTFCVPWKWQNNKTKMNPNVWFNPRLAEKSRSTDFRVQHSFVFFGRNISVTLCNSWRLTMFLRWILFLSPPRRRRQQQQPCISLTHKEQKPNK